MKTICLFNHKGGVSKTTTAFNLGWVLSDLGKNVLLIDLDSQCNLTGLVMGYNSIDDDHMERFYSNRECLTMEPVVQALIDGVSPDAFLNVDRGELLRIQRADEHLFLLPGHLSVSELDAQISVSLKIATGIPATRNIPGNLPMYLTSLAKKYDIDYVIYDLSPNVGGLNEVILMSSDFFIVPATPDFFCLQAVGSLEKHIKKWHDEIDYFKKQNKFNSKDYPIKNSPMFLGAIQQRYRPRHDRPTVSFEKWITAIREAINNNFVPSLRENGCVVDEELMRVVLEGSEPELKPYDLAQISDFNSLIAISQQLSKPVFSVTDEELKEVGRVFGQAFETFKENRDNFAKVFRQLGERVIALIEKSSK